MNNKERVVGMKKNRLAARMRVKNQVAVHATGSRGILKRRALCRSCA